MPYYVGAGTPEWDQYMDGAQTESEEPLPSLFSYIEPSVAETTVLAFSETPGPEPEVPRRAAFNPRRAPKPGFFARLFGAKAPPVEETPQPTPEQMFESYQAEQKAAAAQELWEVSRLTAPCRALGVKRVFASYDGGGDESFTYFRGVEMSDGHVLTADSLRQEEPRREEVQGIDFEPLVEHAAAALMGSFDAGEFILHGVLIIDFDACTITDEKNADVVFGGKMPWEV
jgi:hypothetical protein